MCCLLVTACVLGCCEGSALQVHVCLVVFFSQNLKWVLFFCFGSVTVFCLFLFHSQQKSNTLFSVAVVLFFVYHLTECVESWQNSPNCVLSLLCSCKFLIVRYNGTTSC